MESKLYESAVEGSVEKLLELLKRDHLILDGAAINSLSETPLHVAAMAGHTEIVKEMLRRNPEFAKALDSRSSSPLHLASAKGHVEIVRELLKVDSDMCFARDEDGRNPLHLAAMKGRIDVLKELLRARQEAALAGADQGGTILHVCVKNNQLEALKILVEAINDYQFMNKKDDFGFTVLLLAVFNKQFETVNFLLTRLRIETRALASNEITQLDIVNQSPGDPKDLNIAVNLRADGASQPTANFIPPSAGNQKKDSQTAGPLNYTSLNRKRERKQRLANKKNAIMVVASLVATMAFAAGLTPPGGLWQDNSKKDESEQHEAGKSILASGDPDLGIFGFYGYIFFNTIGLVASLSVIILLITGLPFKRGFFMWVLTIIMWVAISSMAFSYLIAIANLTPEKKMNEAVPILSIGLIVWIAVMGFVVLGHTIHLVIMLCRKVYRTLHKKTPVFVPQSSYVLPV